MHQESILFFLHNWKVNFESASFSSVAAGIISFGEAISVRRRGSVLLPCLAVGIPPPERTWYGTEGKPIVGDPFHLQSNGSLHITDIQRQNQGNYSCSVNNVHGSDEISYFLRVLGKSHGRF